MPERAKGIDGVFARRGREVDFLRAEIEHRADQPSAGRHDEPPASAARRAVQQFQKTGRMRIQAVEISAAAVAAEYADRGQLVPCRAADAQQKTHAHAQLIHKKAAGEQRKAQAEQHERADEQHTRPAKQPCAYAEIAGDGARNGAQTGQAGQIGIAQNANQAASLLTIQKKALSSLSRLCGPFVYDMNVVSKSRRWGRSGVGRRQRGFRHRVAVASGVAVASPKP